jgi:site-specific DNA-methyltransferase (adenine-specific)
VGALPLPVWAAVREQEVERGGLMEPYYQDDQVTLYLGDCREVVPALGLTADCIVADPPYAETSLDWDRWPDGWPAVLAEAARSMWCFGSLRMFMDRTPEFARWRFSHDVIWEKHNGSGTSDGKFLRVHEQVAHWYQGPWAEVHKEPRRERVYGVDKSTRRPAGAVQHRNTDRATTYADDGTRAPRSVLKVRSMHGRAIHPTEKPVGVLSPLIDYACPPGGVVLDPFAGSGSTADAARLTGRGALLVEQREVHCEAIVRRLQQDVLPLETT